MDRKTRTDLEAAVYRRLVDHLRMRTDVQNIDLMNLIRCPRRGKPRASAANEEQM